MQVSYQVKTARKGFYVFSAVTLLVLGLNVPKVSVLAVLAALGVVFVRWKGDIVYGFPARCSLLLIFSLTYYVTMYFYDFKDLTDVIINPLFITSAYALGFSITRTNTPDWPSGLVWIVLAMVSGFVAFSFLSVYTAMSSGHGTDILFRSAPNYWKASESINGPILGLFASLGLSLAPVLFLSTGEPFPGRRRLVLLIAAVSLLVGAGLYVNVSLQNRSPFVALLLSFLLSAYYYFFIRRISPKHKARTVMSMILFLCVAAYLFVSSGYDYSQFSLVGRFEVKGLETDRFGAWMYMLRALPDNLAGGRVVYIGNIDYVHDLWLDVVYDAGIIPVIFLLLFHALHVKSFADVFRADIPLLLALVILSVSVSFLVGFIGEPVLQGSVIYFSASCFLLGLVSRLSTDVKMAHTYYRVSQQGI